MLVLCIVCSERPATVPDRETMGRPIKKVCGQCHAARLRGDMHRIMARRKAYQERLKRNEP